MEKITPFGQELIFATSDKASSKRLTLLIKNNKVRKIATRVYTTNMDDDAAVIVRRNLFTILGRLYPKAVISHRSAFEFKPTPAGHIFLTYNYTRKVSLPGLTVHLMEGHGGLPEDTPFIEGLYLSRPERAFLENMQVVRRSGDASKVLPQTMIEEKLETIARTNGEEALNELRDKARSLSVVLGMQDEFERLNNLIGALLSTRPSAVLKSPLALSRAYGKPFDPKRIELFEILYEALASSVFPTYPDGCITPTQYRNFAFFESYFSNYIEGTEFEIEDALHIIETNTPMEARGEESHDVLGTFYLVSNRNEMSKIPQTADDLCDILRARHRILLSARQSKMPGMFKMQNNRAGNTHFVDFTLVRGTLDKGFEYYNALIHPFARALFMMFMVSETHPFMDGNGRISRVMMNAELTHGGQTKIIIPTVFRNDYITALRKLSRQDDPSVLIKAMQRLQRFCATLVSEDINELLTTLKNADAFEDSEEHILKFFG